MFSEENKKLEWRSLGERLKEAREYLNMTQKNIADLSGLTVRGYLNYEQGLRGAPAHLLNIYSGLGINVNWLLSGDGSIFKRDPETDTELIHGILGEGFSELADAIGTLESNVPADILKDFYKVVDAFPPKLREELVITAKQYYEQSTVENLVREVEELKKELAELKAKRISTSE
jgi:hypothetical protein